MRVGRFNLEYLVLWSIAASSLTSILGWACVVVYLTVVLLVIILICGIQLVRIERVKSVLFYLYSKGKTVDFISLVFNDDIHVNCRWSCQCSCSSRISTTGLIYHKKSSFISFVELSIDKTNQNSFFSPQRSIGCFRKFTKTCQSFPFHCYLAMRYLRHRLSFPSFKQSSIRIP